MTPDLLAALLARLIPASDRAPSGAGLGVPQTLRRLAQSDRHLATAMDTCCAALPTQVDDAAIRALEEAQPEAFALLLRHLYMAYYSQPAARAILGLSPKPPQPDGYEVPVESAEMIAALTAPVRARGACFRPTPGGDDAGSR